MNPTAIQARVKEIESKREFLVKLLERPDLGLLSLDVNQAIEEMDELIAEFKQTFPEN
ncbi:MAG: hypothetical protein HC805_06735 [Alkalinema sp. RL_2_19]|nr:hypothetical protein [Alkalinema sp. RL_2_19]